MSNFLTEIKGWTPLMDAMVRELGLVRAAVYGVVWRHCQMKDRVCKASQETLAEILGIDRVTLNRHLKALVEAGYLIDTTPDRRNAPHVYKDAGKVLIRALLEAQVNPEGVTLDNTEPAEVLQKVTPVLQKVTPGCNLKLQEETDTIEDTYTALFGVLAEVCQIDTKLATEKQRQQLAQSVKKLQAAEVKAAELARFPAWWSAEDWRGKKGQPPQPHQVRECWGAFKASAFYAPANNQIGW